MERDPVIINSGVVVVVTGSRSVWYRNGKFD